MRRAWWCLGASGAVAVVACGPRPEQVVPTPSPPAPVPQPSVEPVAPKPSAAPVAASAAPATEPEPVPVPGAEPGTAARCEADADCAFDDPCVPMRCVAGHDAAELKCAEAAPEPGRCLCVASRCTLKPRELPTPEGPCEVRGCAVDRAGGVCVADTQGKGPGFRTNSGLDWGPSCDCREPTRGCEMTWHERIPCRTERDCWVEEEPRPHPVRRPAHLRGRPFRPCHDGDIAPRCTDSGHCALDMLRRYRC